MAKINSILLERLEDYLALIFEEYEKYGIHYHIGISYDEIAMIKRIIDSKEYPYGHDRDNLNRIEKWFNQMNKVK
jgi:hypothetical protein